VNTDSRNDIRVMIADDHPLIVEGLASVLARHDLSVVGSAGVPEQVVPTFEQLQPDVLILDLRFGDAGTGGLDILSILADKGLDHKVIVYTQFEHDPVIREAYKRGARAFVPKSADPTDLAQVIRRVAAGETVFMPDIAARLAMLGVHGDASPLARLQPRELEVFKLMARGLTNVEIAEQMSLSPKTISMTSQSIKDQLGMHRAADLTLLAVRHGLIEP